jgi:hypothetical protein
MPQIHNSTHSTADSPHPQMEKTSLDSTQAILLLVSVLLHASTQDKA